MNEGNTPSSVSRIDLLQMSLHPVGKEETTLDSWVQGWNKTHDYFMFALQARAGSINWSPFFMSERLKSLKKSK